MRLFSACPALAPACAALAGAGLGLQLTHFSVPLVALLLALGLALGRRRGWLLAWAAAGLGSVALQVVLPAQRAPAVDPERPVTAVLEPLDAWRRDALGWWAPAAVTRLRQGARVMAGMPSPVFLHLSGDEAPPAAGVLRVRGYLRRGAGFANPPPVDPGPPRLAVKSRQLVTVEAPPGPLLGLSERLRRRVEAAWAAAAPPSPGVALVRALLLGDTTDLPAPWLRALRRLGLSHLLAVSGLHVGLLAALVLLATTALDRRPRLLLVLLAIALYLLLAGPRPSLLRAAFMGLLAAAALLLERPPSTVNALAGFLVLVVLLAPHLLLDLGFQLSAAATAALVLAAPALEQRWSALPLWLSRPLAVTVAAQVATLPWALPAFHLLSPVAPLTNLVMVPWSAVALAAGLLWTALALVVPPLAAVAAPLLDLLAWPCAVLAALPPDGWTAFAFPLSPLPALLLAAVLGAALWWPRRLGLPLLVLALAWTLWPQRSDPAAEAVLLDVGQGDAILLRDGPRALLVDGGGWARGDLGGRVLVPALAGLGVKRLEAMVLSHADRDHCGGLADLADYLPVGRLWAGASSLDTECGRDLVERRGLPASPLAAGDRLELGRWRLQVLHPPAGARGDGNDQSLVLRAELGPGFCLLLTGDVEAAAEGQLAADPGPLRCAVLKVAHHGSTSSSTPGFLHAVAPRLALISAGRGNAYGHPAPAVLRRLEGYGARVLRTDLHGAIRLRPVPGGGVRLEVVAWPGAGAGAPRVLP